MSSLRLSLACWGYDRTNPLATGAIKPAGIELVCLDQPVEETFFRMARHREFDVAEMSLSTYCITLMKDDPDFIRRALYRQHPWIAVSLAKAFGTAKAEVMRDLYELAALKTMLPWQVAHVTDTKAVLGEDWWPYGLEPNRHALDTFLGYHHEQGLSQRRLKPEELFAPEALEDFKI
jgi:hypothetical protein